MAGIFTKAKLALLKPDKLFESVWGEGITQTLFYYIIIDLIFGLAIPVIAAIVILSSLYQTLVPLIFNQVIYFPIGILGLFVVAFFIHIGIRLLKGKGNYTDTYRAAVYGSTPGVVFSIFILLPLYGFLGLLPFPASTPPQLIDDPSFIFSLLTSIAIMAIVGILLFIWTLVLGVKGLSRFHKISGWRAFGAIVIGYVILLAIALAIVFSFLFLFVIPYMGSAVSFR